MQSRLSFTVRRLFDIICALAGLILLSPLLAAIALAVWLGDGGPVLYSQTRVGKDFRKFRLHKFRSMVPGADRRGPLLTAPHDPRITRVGRFLRRHKLDELPQLANLLKGEMRLVGARPELERYVELFRSEYARLLIDRPGITDPASLAYRDEHQTLDPGGVEAHYVNEVLPHKLALSLDYAARRTALSDLGVILRTVFGLGAASNPAVRPASKATPSAPDISSKTRS